MIDDPRGRGMHTVSGEAERRRGAGPRAETRRHTSRARLARPVPRTAAQASTPATTQHNTCIIVGAPITSPCILRCVTCRLSYMTDGTDRSLRHRRTQRCSNGCYRFHTGNTAEKQTTRIAEFGMVAFSERHISGQSRDSNS
jgi:hypothetical protein